MGKQSYAVFKEDVVEEECFKKEFQCFLARLRSGGKTPCGHFSFEVTIPKQIVKMLGLKVGDVVEIAIRPADVKTMQEYGYSP